jgi:hypothetical protein
VSVLSWDLKDGVVLPKTLLDERKRQSTAQEKQFEAQKRQRLEGNANALKSLVRRIFKMHLWLNLWTQKETFMVN